MSRCHGRQGATKERRCSKEGGNTIEQVCVGIDLGGSKIKLGLFDLAGTCIHELRMDTPIEQGYEGVLRVFSLMIEEVLQQTGRSWENIQGIGIGVPAFIDYKHNVLLHVTNLGWRNIHLKSDLENMWHKPVFIDNDANMAALGELWYGAGQDAEDFLCLTIGTGIGSGIIIGRNIYRGHMGLAGEIGHISLSKSKDRKCNCGRYGCLETEVSSRAIELDALELVQKRKSVKLLSEYRKQGRISAKFIIDQALAGDEDCRRIISHAGTVLGMELANIATILNPQKVIIGGGISAAEHILMGPLIAAFRSVASPLIAEHTEIVLAQLGNRAGIQGAAGMAIHGISPQGGARAIHIHDAMEIREATAKEMKDAAAMDMKETTEIEEESEMNNAN